MPPTFTAPRYKAINIISADPDLRPHFSSLPRSKEHLSVFPYRKQTRLALRLVVYEYSAMCYIRLSSETETFLGA